MDEVFSYNKEEDNFYISYKKSLGSNMAKHHFHSTYEMFFLSSGERQFFVKDRTINIKEGSLLIINPNILHKTMNGEAPQYERVIVNFHNNFLYNEKCNYQQQLCQLFKNDYIVIDFPHHHRIYIKEILDKIISEAKHKHTGFQLQIKSLVLQLLIFSCRFIEETQIQPLQYISSVHERVSEIVKYINSNYSKNLTLQYIADNFYISSYYLSRVFKEVTGFTFVQYLNLVRVKEAKKLLEETNLKVYTIAKKTGFGSVTHFGRVFKEITEHTPLYYRKTKKY
ncbi:AraC-like protein [Natranaerovirga pectinivora]|uniref:AraC-like protein n=1 Tax=Natranaerovirga pectinivora TaxID=682400 RepID=A0A4R3MGW6_9FIRM|nr:AraC family transcriptional regulator [Natranaerovirga pectinivora]TCT12890.1 AraC-like protein [Natranaerovirga pectinivora]